MRLVTTLFVLAVGLLLPLTAAAQEHAPGRIIVRFAEAPPGCDHALPACWPGAWRTLQDAGLRDARPLMPGLTRRGPAARRMSRTFIVEGVPDADLTVLTQLLSQRPGVESAEPDWIGSGAGIVPNEPLFPMLWGLEQPNDADVDALGAWAITMGSEDVIIAVLDTGIDLDHPDFAGKLLPGRDMVNGDNDPSDDHGHGSNVAGLAAAIGDNG